MHYKLGLLNINSEVKRFLVIGVITVFIDLICYRLLLWLGILVAIAKAASFITGTLFAYFTNRTWTFRSNAKGSLVFVKFLGVYLCTLLVNVGVNSFVLSLMNQDEIGIWIAFLIATGLSATLNFLGMKFIVFKL